MQTCLHDILYDIHWCRQGIGDGIEVSTTMKCRTSIVSSSKMSGVILRGAEERLNSDPYGVSAEEE